MKKMMMLVVLGMVGTAGAAGTLNAPVKFTANVTTICRVAGVPFGTINAPTINAPDISYQASQTSNLSSSVALPSGINIECTKGTALTIKATPQDGTPTTVTSYNLTTPEAAMNLTMGANKLNGKYSLTTTKVDSTSQMIGDKYTGSVTYKATAGQWGAPEGTYTGTLNIVISYQ